MKTIKIIAGITWAFLCLIVIIAFFPANVQIATSLSKLPFMKINPNYSGGEVVKEIKKGNYSINVHRPVFDRLIGEGKTGFVQVDWRGQLPGILNDTIDFDNDSKNDFVVQVDTLNTQSQIVKINPKVGELEVSTHTSFGWAIRVGLVK